MELLFFSLSGLGFLYVLKYCFRTKGIFDPKYPLFMSIVLQIFDGIFKLFSYNSLLIDASWEIDSFFAVFMWICIAIYGILYVLCRKLLPSIPNRRIRKTSSSVNYSRLAKLLICFGLVYGIINCLLLDIFEYEDEFLRYIFIVYTFLITVIYYFTFAFDILRYERIKHEADRTIMALKTKRAPLIFLRSFELDKYPVLGRTFDEYICYNFSLTSQPIISLSDPDDFLPTGGSIKIQSCDAQWKDAIVTLLNNCRAVVIFEGRSDGLQWEIENLKKYISYDKLFVVTPPFIYRMRAWYQCSSFSIIFHKFFHKRSINQTLDYVWSRFAAHMCNEGMSLTTSNPGSSKIFAFDDKWKSVNIPEKISQKDLFDQVLINTVKYEHVECDYQTIGEELSKYELSQCITNQEKTTIKKSSIKIVAIVVMIYIVTYMLI